MNALNDRPAVEPAIGGSSARGPLAALSLAMLLSSLGTSIANVALPTLAASLDASFQQVQWVVLAYLLAVTTLIVSVGRLGDMIGRRRLLLAGLALFTVASGFCGLAPSLWFLVAARAVQGLGAAILMALAMALVGETVPKDRTGRAMGLLGTVSAIGTALGPTLGGALIGGFGWPAIFHVNLPLGVVALVLAYRYLPPDRRTATSGSVRFDKLGTLLLAMTLAAYALAMTIGWGSFGAVNIALGLAALLGVAFFTLVQAKSDAPLVRLAMFRDPVLSAGFVTSALVMTVLMTTLVVGPFYLSGAFALDAARVGLVMSTGPIVAALTGIPAGRMVDRFGAQNMTAIGLVGIAAGSTALSTMPAAAGIAGYIAPLVLVTASYALFQAANNTAVMADVRPDQRGLVSGLLNLSRNLGLITGASVMGAIFAFAAHAPGMTAVQPESVAAGMRTTFAVAAAMILSALIVVLWSRTLVRRRA